MKNEHLLIICSATTKLISIVGFAYAAIEENIIAICSFMLVYVLLEVVMYEQTKQG